ncbi:MAG: hypothetical protein QXU99_04995 [Candidatus Bathyarchaeia archaeon]
MRKLGEWLVSYWISVFLANRLSVPRVWLVGVLVEDGVFADASVALVFDYLYKGTCSQFIID